MEGKEKERVKGRREGKTRGGRGKGRDGKGIFE